MNICIFFDLTEGPWGGGNQFFRALRGAFESSGHTVTNRPDRNTDVVLVNSHNRGPGRNLWPGTVAQIRQTGKEQLLAKWVPYRAWLIIRRRGPAIIHRLDGVPELIRGSRTRADRLIPAINHLTDLTIFQSHYSRTSFAEFGIRPDYSHIIYNGVDPHTFFPDPNHTRESRKLRLIAVSWSPNPRKGFATLAEISRVSDVELQFVGRWCEGIDPGEVVILGPKTSTELADIMRSCDVMVHAAENESCSNAIIEALACGLPVLYRDSGGNRELAGEYGVALTNSPNNDIARISSEFDQLRMKVLSDNKRFSISEVARRYLDAFGVALSKRGLQSNA